MSLCAEHIPTRRQRQKHIESYLKFKKEKTKDFTCCINRFISLCRNWLQWTAKHWKWCTRHRKASAKNSSKLNKFLHSEVNLLIQHYIAQDQDGQNNNTLHVFKYLVSSWFDIGIFSPEFVKKFWNILYINKVNRRLYLKSYCSWYISICLITMKKHLLYN